MGKDCRGQQECSKLYVATSTDAPPPPAKPGKRAHEGPRACERLKQIWDVPSGDGTHSGGATILHFQPSHMHVHTEEGISDVLKWGAGQPCVRDDTTAGRLLVPVCESVPFPSSCINCV